MAITFQHKIVLRPGSTFCFGTILSVADGGNSTSHHGSVEEKAFLNKLRKSRNEARKSATSSAPNRDSLLQTRNRGSIYPENSAVHLFHRDMDIDH